MLPRLNFLGMPAEHTLLSYQETAAEWLSRRARGLVQSPAGSGKTIIAASALARVVLSKPRERLVRVGWLANTNEQCDQARAAIKMFPGLARAIELTVCCPAGAPDKWEVDVLIVDEAHHAGGAVTWLAIIEAHAGCVWFMTATPFGEDAERNAKLRALCDHQIHVVPREAVASRVVAGEVYLLTDTDGELREPIDAEIAEEIARRRKFSQLSYDELYRQTASNIAIARGVCENRARNAAIVATARRHREDSTLILVPKIEHGEALAAAIPGSRMCFSKMGKKKRREAIEAARAGELRCMVATSLADEGLDVPVFNVLIMAGAGRSAGRIEQRCGRVLRAHGDKTHGIIYDFTDFQHPLLANQSKARQAVYRRLQYRIHAERAAREVGEQELLLNTTP